MNNNITLNASMRSNLLSLRNISKQMDKTQLILATGKKVNSAIDNASAYYQARSLSNRAADLTALLDAMGQGIQTIEAATQGLTSGAEFLEQASAITMQAATASILTLPEKEWFVEQVGENGAVVSTAQELRDAIAAGKETICVYGAIDLGDISTSGGLTLKANQKLVGVGYFGNYDTTTDKFSSITATASATKNMINITGDNCVVSDLSINYQCGYATNNVGGVIYLSASGVTTNLKNLNIVANFDDTNVSAAIASYNLGTSSTINISGINNIEMSGRFGVGLYGRGIEINVGSNAIVNINNISEKNGYGIELSTDCILNAKQSSRINIKTVSFGMLLYTSGTANIHGNIYIESDKSNAISLYYTGNNHLNIASSAEVYFNQKNEGVNIQQNGGNGANTVDIMAGAKIAFEKDGNVKWYRVKENYNYQNTSTSKSVYISFDNVENILNVENTTAWSLPEIIAEMADSTNGDLSGYSASYQKILDEYDNLIMDSSYQGVNLLNGALKEITLNENRSSKYKVEGKDMSSKNIGLSRDKWETLDDVTKAMNELTAAVNSIRSFQEELGNHYSIIKTRINFTEALTDVLETGADNLTLADMNEASAEYLTLQTRQQLAINSLSLASQAARSVLSLF